MHTIPLQYGRQKPNKDVPQAQIAEKVRLLNASDFCKRVVRFQVRIIVL